MVTRKDIKELFDLTKIAEHEDELRRKAMLKEAVEDAQKAKMLEYFVEYMNPNILMAIHSTNQFPEKGILRPTGHFLFNGVHSANAKEIIKDIDLRYPRMTIHFTLNYAVEGVVARGGFVKWDCKYAILIPLVDFLDRVVCLNAVDTWIIGDLELPRSAEILMPETEYFTAQKKLDSLSGKATIVPYPKNKNLIESVLIRIQKRGYPIVKGGDFAWFQATDFQAVDKFIEISQFLSLEEKQRLLNLTIQKGYRYWGPLFSELAKKLGKESIPHSKTDWAKMEKWADEFYGVLFDPHEDEIEEPLTNYLAEIRFSGHTLHMLTGSAHLWKTRVEELLGRKEYSHPQEVKYLTELRNIFARIEEWLKVLQKKGVKAVQEKPNITWGEFLKREGIIN